MRKKQIGAMLIALGIIISVGTGYVANASVNNLLFSTYAEEEKEEVIKINGLEDEKGKEISIPLSIGDVWTPELHQVEAVDKNNPDAKYQVSIIEEEKGPNSKEDTESIFYAINEEGVAEKVGAYNVTFIVTDVPKEGQDVSELPVKAEFIQKVIISSEDIKVNIPQVTGSNVGLTAGSKLDIKRFGIQVFDIEDSKDEKKQVALEESIKIDTSKVDTNKPGQYEVSVSATDSDGNIGKATFVVTVIENAKPTIESALSNNRLRIFVGDKFDVADLKIVAHDANDGDLTDKIKFEGVDKVNTKEPGEYKISATVVDSYGTTVTEEFVVEVVSNNIPIVSGENLEIFIGEKLEKSEMKSRLKIKATDVEDGDLTEEVQLEYKIDLNKIGTYKVLAAVMDSDGNIGKTDLYVKISEKEAKPLEKDPTNNNPNTGDSKSATTDLGVGLSALAGLIFLKKR